MINLGFGSYIHLCIKKSCFMLVRCKLLQGFLLRRLYYLERKKKLQLMVTLGFFFFLSYLMPLWEFLLLCIQFSISSNFPQTLSPIVYTETNPFSTRISIQIIYLIDVFLEPCDGFWYIVVGSAMDIHCSETQLTSTHSICIWVLGIYIWLQ